MSVMIHLNPPMIRSLPRCPLYLKIMMFSIPLPYLAIQFGWLLTEIGRQPWIVYGLVRTSDAASPVSVSQVGVSLIGFILVYGILGAAGFYLMYKKAIKGPDLPPEEPAGTVGSDELQPASSG